MINFFFIYIILYINSVESYSKTYAKFSKIRKKKNKSAKLKESIRVQLQNKNVSKINRVIIGSQHKLSNKEIISMSTIRNIIKCPKWLVRGHWRNQSFGINMEKRKMVWIKPHEKGE